MDSNETSIPDTSDYYEIWNFSSNIWKILIVFVSVFVCFLTQIGNVLVLLSFRLNKKLRVTNNYFLVSLAIADLIIGFYSMPVFTIYVISGEWILGPYFCDLWLCLDYTVSNASVGSLLLISFDRYFSITRPLSYRVNRTTKKVACLIALVWLISVVMWSPFIIGWPYVHGGRIIADSECKVQFLQSSQYLTLITAILAFYLPVTIICVLYFQIWRVTKLRQVELRKLQCQKYTTRMKKGENNESKKSEESTTQSLVPKETTNFDITNEKKLSFCSRYIKLSCIKQKSIESTDEAGEDSFKYKVTSHMPVLKCTHCHANLESDIKKQEESLKNDRTKIEVKCSNCQKVVTLRFDHIRFSIDDQSSSANKVKRTSEVNKSKKQKKNSEKKADQKAAKTLSALLFAFLITWLPYNVNVVVNSFCGNCLDNYEFWSFFAYWLCYTNSTINPVLYAMCNANFRKTFKDILTCNKINQSI